MRPPKATAAPAPDEDPNDASRQAHPTPSKRRWKISRRIRQLLQLTIQTVRHTRDEAQASAKVTPFAAPPLPFAFGRTDSSGNAEFTITKFLGEGQSAQVFRGERGQLSLDGHTCHVTVKIFHRVEGKDAVDQLRREGSRADRVRDVHVVRVLGSGVWQDHHAYIVGDDHDGTDLEKWAAERFNPDASPDEEPSAEECVRIVRDAARGVAAAHVQGVIHRDIAPRNILICADGISRIMDFGCAAITEEAVSSTVVGTPGFMPTEQWLRGASLPQCDVAALGGVLFWLLTGHLPYGEDHAELAAAHENPAAQQAWRERVLHAADAPPPIAEAILNAMRPSLLQRTGDAKTFADCLDAWLNSGAEESQSDRTAPDGHSEPQPLSELQPSASAPKHPGRDRRRLAAAVAAILCVVGAIGFQVVRSAQQPVPMPTEQWDEFCGWLGAQPSAPGVDLLGKRLFEMGAVQFSHVQPVATDQAAFASAIAVADAAEDRFYFEPNPLTRVQCSLAIATLAFEAGDDQRLVWWLARSRDAINDAVSATTPLDPTSLQQFYEVPWQSMAQLRWYRLAIEEEKQGGHPNGAGRISMPRLVNVLQTWEAGVNFCDKILLNRSSFMNHWSEAKAELQSRQPTSAATRE